MGGYCRGRHFRRRLLPGQPFCFGLLPGLLFRFDLLLGAEPAVVLEQGQGVFVQILMAGLVYHRQIALLFPDGVLPLEPVLNLLVLLIGVGQPNGNDAGFFISGYFHAVSPFIQIVAGCGVL
jgi:hypothetical protein